MNLFEVGTGENEEEFQAVRSDFGGHSVDFGVAHIDQRFLVAGFGEVVPDVFGADFGGYGEGC